MRKATEVRDCVHVEVTVSSDSKIRPRLQYKRKDELADQPIKFQNLAQGWRATIGRASQRSD